MGIYAAWVCLDYDQFSVLLTRGMRIYTWVCIGYDSIGVLLTRGKYTLWSVYAITLFGVLLTRGIDII